MIYRWVGAIISAVSLGIFLDLQIYQAFILWLGFDFMTARENHNYFKQESK